MKTGLYFGLIALSLWNDAWKCDGTRLDKNITTDIMYLKMLACLVVIIRTQISLLTSFILFRVRERMLE